VRARRAVSQEGDEIVYDSVFGIGIGRWRLNSGGGPNLAEYTMLVVVVTEQRAVVRKLTLESFGYALGVRK
jgi:hypothetical protein